MLETIAVILGICWLFGFVVFPNLGSLIHILLVLCVIVVLVRLLRGREAVGD